MTQLFYLLTSIKPLQLRHSLLFLWSRRVLLLSPTWLWSSPRPIFLTHLKCWQERRIDVCLSVSVHQQSVFMLAWAPRTCSHVHRWQLRPARTASSRSVVSNDVTDRITFVMVILQKAVGNCKYKSKCIYIYIEKKTIAWVRWFSTHSPT